MNRRAFLQMSAGATGGLLIAFALPGCKTAPKDQRAFFPNAFLRIDQNSTVTLIIPRPEMGQGVRTSLAMILAEELDCDWRNVKIQQAELNEEKYGYQYVGGSSSIRDSYEPLRKAGAGARMLLTQAAANRWKLNASECKTRDSRVHHPANGTSIPYGELAAEASALPLPKTPTLKAAKDFRLVGKKMRNVDTADIVTGRIRYGIDQRMPEMLFAAIQRCPVFGGRIARYDDRQARAMSGVKHIVRIDAELLPELGEDNPKPPSGVAVVATSTWIAMKAAEALKVEWDLSAAEKSSTQEQRREWLQRVQKPGRWIYRNDGDCERALASAHRIVEAVYELPLLSHATMEPMNCLASVRNDAVEILCPAQNPGGVRDVAHRLTGIPLGSIHVQPVRMGGGFGRRFYSDFATEAILISKTIGKPVQVIWTREEDMRHGFFRPSGIYRIRGALNRNGNITGWSEHLVNSSRGHFLKWTPPPGKELKPGEIGRDDFPAGFIPNYRIEYTQIDSLIPRGQWRAVEDSSNAFVIQSFLAELAHAAGKDPLAMNLELIGAHGQVAYEDGTYDASRLRKVFEVAAARGNWGAPLPSGRGRGIAGCFSHGTYAAEVAEVEVESGGNIRVLRIVAAVDCGTVVNPMGVEAQAQGGIIFGLSAALKQEITVTKGRVDQGSFDDFPMVHIHEAPQIEVHIVPSDAAPGGAGEGTVAQVAPAVANAIFAATGKRLRRLPLKMDS